MIDALIHLVVILLIVGVIWWAVMAILPLIPLPAPIVVPVLVLILYALLPLIFYALLPLLHISVHAL